MKKELLDSKALEKLLKMPAEQDAVEFKREFVIYDKDKIIINQKKDEFFKDILCLANGKSNLFVITNI